MNTVEINISKWTYFLALVVLLICISCTKDELDVQDGLSSDLMHIDDPNQNPKPTQFNP